jgi:hypothetical protein
VITAPISSRGHLDLQVREPAVGANNRELRITELHMLDQVVFLPAR